MEEKYFADNVFFIILNETERGPFQTSFRFVGQPDYSVRIRTPHLPVEYMALQTYNICGEKFIECRCINFFNFVKILNSACRYDNIVQQF